MCQLIHILCCPLAYLRMNLHHTPLQITLQLSPRQMTMMRPLYGQIEVKIRNKMPVQSQQKNVQRMNTIQKKNVFVSNVYQFKT